MEDLAIKRYIAVTKANREFLIKLFKVTNRTISNSLDLDLPSTDVRRRIRRAAIEGGGEVMVTLREVETIHDANNRMIQTFPNGARLEIDKTTGNATIIYKGEEIAKFENVMISQLYDIQSIACHLGNKYVTQTKDNKRS